MKRANGEWLVIVVVVLAIAASGAAAEEGAPHGVMSTADAGGPTLLLRTSVPGLYVPAPTVRTDVDLEIRGFVVRGTVTQVFENPTDVCVESIYVFPLPENAAVDHLVMIAGGRRIVGEIREREEARRLYETAKQEGRRSSLLEQERPNMFTVELSGLAPRESVQIEIGYQQTLDYVGGRYAMRLPLVVGPRYEPGSTGSGGGSLRVAPGYAEGVSRGSVNVTARLDAGAPLAEIASPSHAIDSTQLGDTSWEIRLEHEVPADRDFVLEWTPRLGSEPSVSSVTEQVTRPDGSTEHFTLVTFLPPGTDAAPSSTARELVIVIDTSGSMQGESLEQAKRAVALALGRLNPADRFWLIEFNSVTRSMTAEPVWADAATVEGALEWVEDLDANGGTEILPALQIALGLDEVRAGMMRQVIFVTDGMVSNEDQLARYVRERIGSSRLFTVGIGSAPNGHLMRSLSRQGRGTFTHVGGVADVSRSMGRLFSMIESPALTDIRLDVDDPTAEIYPDPISDLYGDQPVVATIRSSKPLATIRFEGRVGSRIVRDELTPTQRSGAISGIEKLWARQKIAVLEERQLEQRRSMREPIIEVALLHGIVSSYTSLVAVDEMISNAAGTCTPVLIPLEVPKGMEMFDGMLPGTATPAVWLVLIGLLLMAVAASIAVSSRVFATRRCRRTVVNQGSER